MNIAARLKLVRKKLKLTQEKFAISLGLNRDSIASLESEKVKISTLHALALEYVHGVNKEWLLHGKGEMLLPKNDIRNNNSKLTRIVIEHQDIVKRFKNPEKAKETNEDLINLEDIDEQGYEEARNFIKFKIKNSDSKKKTTKETSSTKKRRANGK